MSTTTATHTDQLGSRPIGPLLWHACSQTTLSVGVYGIYVVPPESWRTSYAASGSVAALLVS